MKKSLLLSVFFMLSGCTGAVTVPPAASPPGTVEASPAKPAAPTKIAGQTGEEMVEPGEKYVRRQLDHARLLNQLLFASSRSDPEAILAGVVASGDTRFVAGLIDTLRYQRSLTLDIGSALNKLTDEDLPPDWFEWVEWAGQHPEIKSFAGYPAWKANLFAQIDPNFLRFVHDGMNIDPGSRIEEIVWGGVRVDGIPALDNPTMVDPAEAGYLVPEERVFGVSINGDLRAYPARFLDWHEMFNDIVGGEPVSLAY